MTGNYRYPRAVADKVIDRIIDKWIQNLATERLEVLFSNPFEARIEMAAVRGALQGIKELREATYD